MLLHPTCEPLATSQMWKQKVNMPLANTTLYKTLCVISSLTVSVHCLFHRSVLLTYYLPPAWAMAPPYVYVYPQ